MGSLNIPILGALKVNTTKQIAIINSAKMHHFLDSMQLFSEFKRLNSYIKATAAEMKNIAIFIQSGDLPIAPL